MSTLSLSITGEQIRAARALARTEQAELAQRSSLSLQTIKRLEGIRGMVDANVRTLNAIVRAFEDMGVRFLAYEEGAGVCKIGTEPAPQSAVPVTASVRAPNAASPLIRVTYFSRSLITGEPQLTATLRDIVQTSTIRNSMLGVTGALLAHDGCFLQTLEGPRDAVKQLSSAISKDKRHEDLNVVEGRRISERRFADWGLALTSIDDARFKREPAIINGFRPEALTPTDALSLLSMARGDQ